MLWKIWRAATKLVTSVVARLFENVRWNQSVLSFLGTFCAHRTLLFLHSSSFHHEDANGDEENNEANSTPTEQISTACVLPDAFLFVVLLPVAIATDTSICLCESSSRRSKEEYSMLLVVIVVVHF
jgi:hypothetical protein